MTTNRSSLELSAFPDCWKDISQTVIQMLLFVSVCVYVKRSIEDNVPSFLFSWASLHLLTTRMIARPASRVHIIIAGMFGSWFSESAPNWGAGDGGLIVNTSCTLQTAVCLQAKRAAVCL